ncbi:MAG: hypothetical protein R6W83_01645, partial [Cryobacterium sp.]
IFVTAQNMQKNLVISSVYEYDGRAFSRTVKDSPWKYRIVEPPQGRPVLLGQLHISQNPFSGAVMQLQWNASDYQPAEQILPSAPLNLLGACGVLSVDGAPFGVCGFLRHLRASVTGTG